MLKDYENSFVLLHSFTERYKQFFI